MPIREGWPSCSSQVAVFFLKRSRIIFVIQREDAVAFSPHDEMDPEFGRGLRQARGRGIAVYAYRCRVSPKEIALAKEIPVLL